VSAAGAEYWNGYFRDLHDSGRDLDWGGRWTEPFLEPLESAGARRVLELGCGTGHDAARLAGAGHEVTAVDLSEAALARARERYGELVEFVVADLTAGLPFTSRSFDAVMANVSLHMFPWETTRAVTAEIARVLWPGGLFLFHVNAREDRPLRARRRPVARELEPNYVLEQAGQSVRFFSAEELRTLLVGWRDVQLDLVEIRDAETGEVFKVVWRGRARAGGFRDAHEAAGTPADP
jgi:SAM-dependent methyltransferase